MATLVLRTVKGSPLTNLEVDNNFSNINISVGEVDQLTTSATSNLVAAVNELNAVTGVSAATYGGASTVPVFTVNTKGKITEASNVTVAVANSAISGNIIASQIQPTGATPGTYGSSSSIPSLTVDHQGRITSISGNTPSIANTTITGIIQPAQGGTGLSSFTAGTNYVAPGTSTTFTATQTFNGSTSVQSAKITNLGELANVIASSPAATETIYVSGGAVNYFTSNATANWTLNVAWSSGTSLDTAMATGDSITLAVIVPQDATAYYNSAVQIDGNAVTPYWQSAVPTAGTASGIDAYNYTIIKTGSATFTVIASQSGYVNV